MSQFVQFETPEPAPKKSLAVMCQGAGMLRTLDRLGFEVPQKLMAAAEERRPDSSLGKFGFKLDVYDLDERFKLFDVGPSQRMAFKTALRHAGIL